MCILIFGLIRNSQQMTLVSNILRDQFTPKTKQEPGHGPVLGGPACDKCRARVHSSSLCTTVESRNGKIRTKIRSLT